jgi:hypothetical protein
VSLLCAIDSFAQKTLNREEAIMKWRWLLVCVVTAGWSAATLACDLHAVYTPPEAGQMRTGWYAGVHEQFTHYGTLQDDGRRQRDRVGQFLNSSITQMVLGWRPHPRAGVQVNVPLIHRWFKRPDGDEIERGTESGLGDMTLTGHVTVWERSTDTSAVLVGVFGGLKLPTGNSRRLKEELEEGHGHGHGHDHGPPSGIHGHDLALGSGSVDGVIGGSVYVRRHRLFATAALQHTIRTEGDFDYEFADDLHWSAGPGVYVWRGRDAVLGLQLTVTGETKGRDRLAGRKVEDTAATFVFVGPELRFTWGDRLAAEAAVDIPVYRDNTDVQIVPDWRVRAGAIWRF